MAFTDLNFLFVFFPLAWFGYLFVQKNKKINGLYIALVSLLFYAWGSIRSLLVLLFLLGWNYFGVQSMEEAQDDKQRRIWLWINVGVNLLVLFMYKYLNVWLSYLDAWLPVNISTTSLVMPVGLSFYMFSCLSYVFDVYYKKARPVSGLVNFTVFAAFFGRVNMGPIAHYARMADQLEDHPVTRKKSMNGAAMFFQGLFMKVILADNFYMVFSTLAGNKSWLGSLLYGFAYFFQLYFDFAGYSRMARGIGSLFGFEIPANFNLPYTASRVQEFWRRWHISLTDWFREYVYIPLGGNRVDTRRWILNVLAVWLLTGIWHGAQFSFLVWGLYQGGLILLERFFLNKQLEKLPGFVGHIWLVLTQLIGWTFFFSGTLMQGLATVGRYFGIGIVSFADLQAIFVLKTAFLLYMGGIFFSTPAPLMARAAFSRIFKRNMVWAETAAYVMCFVLCIAFLISATKVTFLYAAF